MKNISVIVPVFFVLWLTACKKHAPPSLASLHTHRMHKDWTWSRQQLSSYYMKDDVITTYPDTVMPITVINEHTIRFMDNILLYYGGTGDYMVSVDTSEKLVYVDPDFPGTFNGVAGYQQTVSLEYYYHADSVVYLDITRGKRQYWEWKSSAKN